MTFVSNVLTQMYTKNKPVDRTLIWRSQALLGCPVANSKDCCNDLLDNSVKQASCLDTITEWTTKSLILWPEQQQQVRNTNNNNKSRNANAAFTSPPKTIKKYFMPKHQQRNRKQATTNVLSTPTTTIHRKSKCKSKNNKTCRSVSNSKPTDHSTQAYLDGLERNVKKRVYTFKSKNYSQLQPRSGTTKTLSYETAEAKTTVNNTAIINRTNHLKTNNSVRCKMFVPLPSLGATSFVTLLTIICIETVLLSTMSSCAKTFYMHWNTSNSIFRIDNTDHIIDVNKGNLAFEFDQVHIICPVYEPGAFENETEKYIIYNVSKVEYETCRITNADPRVIAICDKPQKLMFFTITFRPFTPQPGGLEFLPGNDYYFISTSSKDDLYRRIGGRCSTNNMKVVFKVCCAAEEKNKTTETALMGSSGISADSGAASIANGVDIDGINADLNHNNRGHGHNGVNTIGLSGANTGFVAGGAGVSGSESGSGIHLKTINAVGTSINTNIDQFNRIPIQPNIISSGGGVGGIPNGGGGVILSPGHGSINMLPPGRGGVHMPYPGHHHIQSGIRINNVPTQQQNNPHLHHKGNINLNSRNNNDDTHHNHNYDMKHPNEVVKNEELTYNSGSARAARSAINAYNWIWTSLPGGSTTIGLISMCEYGISSTVFIALIVVITFHYLFGTRTALRLPFSSICR